MATQLLNRSKMQIKEKKKSLLEMLKTDDPYSPIIPDTSHLVLQKLPRKYLLQFLVAMKEVEMALMEASGQETPWTFNQFALVFHAFTGQGYQIEKVEDLVELYKNDEDTLKYGNRLNFERRVLFMITGKDEYLKKDRYFWPRKDIHELKNFPEFLTYLILDKGLEVGDTIVRYVNDESEVLIEQAVNFPSLVDYVPHLGAIKIPSRTIIPETTLILIADSVEFVAGIEPEDKRNEICFVYTLLTSKIIPCMQLPIITLKGFQWEEWINMIKSLKVTSGNQQEVRSVPYHEPPLDQQMYPDLENLQTDESDNDKQTPRLYDYNPSEYSKVYTLLSDYGIHRCITSGHYEDQIELGKHPIDSAKHKEILEDRFVVPYVCSLLLEKPDDKISIHTSITQRIVEKSITRIINTIQSKLPAYGETSTAIARSVSTLEAATLELQNQALSLGRLDAVEFNQTRPTFAVPAPSTSTTTGTNNSVLEKMRARQQKLESKRS